MNRSVLILPSTMRKAISPRAEMAEIIDSLRQRVGVAPCAFARASTAGYVSFSAAAECFGHCSQCTLGRTLRREAPTLEVLADEPILQLDAKAAAHQRPDRWPAPQREVQLHLLRAAIDDPIPKPHLVGHRQLAPNADRPPASPLAKSAGPLRTRALEPHLDRAHMHPGHRRQLRTRHPRLLAQPHHHSAATALDPRQ